MEGNLYIRLDSVIASFLLGYALWPREKQETENIRYDDLDDPFELTHKVLNTSTHFFSRKLVKQDGLVVDIPNHRTIARRRLLSKKRRFISTLAGQV